MKIFYYDTEQTTVLLISVKQPYSTVSALTQLA